MKTRVLIKTCEFLLLILSLFLAVKHYILLFPKKSKNSFMSHQKGLLLPLWMENTIDLVVTVIVLLLIIVLS